MEFRSSNSGGDVDVEEKRGREHCQNPLHATTDASRLALRGTIDAVSCTRKVLEQGVDEEEEYDSSNDKRSSNGPCLRRKGRKMDRPERVDE
jgi:hypothetical protein